MFLVVIFQYFSFFVESSFYFFLVKRVIESCFGGILFSFDVFSLLELLAHHPRHEIKIQKTQSAIIVSRKINFIPIKLPWK